MPNVRKYKWLLQGKGLQIQIIKQLLDSVLVAYEELLRLRFVLCASAFGFGR